MSKRGPFIWRRLHLPVPVAPAAAAQAMQALAGISGRPRVVLEASGHDGQISWRLGAERPVMTRVLAALRPHVPGIRDGQATKPVTAPSQAASVHLPGHRRTALNTDATVPVAVSLLAALAEARRKESVRLQLILGPRRRPRSIHDVGPERKQLGAKYDQYRFGCTLRIAGVAATPERTRRLIDGVAAALRGLELPGVRLRLIQTSPGSVVAARSSFLWPLELSVSEVAAVLGWPIASKRDAELPGVPPAHPVTLPVSRSVPDHGRVLGVSTTDDSRTVALSLSDSLRHLHLLGPTGVGKSTVMGNLALQDIEAGRAVAVIDPKGDLVDDLLARIPQSLRDDVVVLDPRDKEPVGIDALGGVNQYEADLSADTLLSVFHSLYAANWGPRTHDILHACLLSLARRGDASLTMVPLLLTNPGFRRSVIGSVVRRDPVGLGSFWAWYDGLSEPERGQAIGPLMNKLRPILLRPGLRAVLGQRAPKFAFADVFTKRRILLVSLSKGTLGAEGAQLLGSVTVALLWQAALKRAAIPASKRHPVMVHIDEVQDYLRLPGDLGDALAQSRSLGVSFTLAGQHLAQFPGALREAILANARSRIAFQLSAKDGRELAKTTGGVLAPEDFQRLPVHQAYASLLAGGATAPWCSLRTQPLPPATSDPAVVRAHSRQRYGRSLDEVERDLLDLTGATPAAAESFGRTSHRKPGDDS